MDGASSQPDIPVPPPENVYAAKAARLRYVNDRHPGITRRGAVGHFVYRTAKGKVIRDARVRPAVCRKCYIHPAVLEGYLNGSLRSTLAAVGKEEEPPEMWQVERMVMRFLAGQQNSARPG